VAAQFRNFGVQAVTSEQGSEFAAKPACGLAAFVPDRITQNIADLLFHAATVAKRALLQPVFHLILEIANDELRHNASAIVLSQRLTICQLSGNGSQRRQLVVAGSARRRQKSFSDCLGIKACEQGVRTLFVTATALITTLGKALAEGKLAERLKLLSQTTAFNH
jgi:hypothetical protein